MKQFLTLLFLVTLFLTSQASHQISTEITYDYLGNDSFLIRVQYVDWCGGTIEANANPPISNVLGVNISCLNSGSVMVGLNLVNTFELPIFCFDTLSLNSCGSAGNAGLTGYSVGVYEKVVNLKSITNNCGIARIVFLDAARAASFSYIAYPNYSTFIDVDYQTIENEHSAQSFRYDIPGSFMDSAQYDLSLAMFDGDGDSLTYHLIPALNTMTYTGGNWQTTQVVYTNGNSATSPAPNFSLDSLTGQVSFYPTIPTGYQHGNYTISLRVDEWNPASGVLKGSTYRDVKFYVLPFSGDVNPDFVGMNNLHGAVLENPMSIRACAGDTFCFDVTFQDQDISDSVYISSNLEFIADYYEINLSGSNPTTASICAVINKTYAFGIDAIIKAWDNNCPMFGQTSLPFHIRTVGGKSETFAGCYSAWDTIQTSSDSISIWSVLSGDSMQTGTNFNCLNAACTQVSVNPFNTTVYLVENFVSGSCSYVDTITLQTDPTVLSGVALDANQNPVANSKVYKVHYDVNNASVSAVDSAITGTGGEFVFPLGIDSFLLKVAPDSASYPNLLPTYFDQQVLVTSADFIQPLLCDTLNLVHTLVSGQNPGGVGFIGGFVSQGAGRAVGDPVKGVTIVLMNDQLDPIALKKTNGNGYFRFDQLTEGNYHLYIDKWNFPNNPNPEISLTTENMDRDSLQFLLFPNRLEIKKPVGLEDVGQSNLSVYPNPTQGEITILSDLELDEIRIVDMLGVVQLKQVSHSNRIIIDLKHFAQGIYFVQCVVDGMVVQQSQIVVQQ